MKFMKKPVVIEAEQFFENIYPLPFKDESVCCLGPEGWYIQTLEGPLHISEGDWILKGYSTKQGYHFWPVKPDYFSENYITVEP